MCGSQRVIFRNRVSPSNLYMPGFALKSLGLAACAFPCWASSPACCYLFLYMHLQECIRARYCVRHWTWISQKVRQEACSRAACILVAIKHKIKWEKRLFLSDKIIFRKGDREQPHILPYIPKGWFASLRRWPQHRGLRWVESVTWQSEEILIEFSEGWKCPVWCRCVGCWVLEMWLVP